MNNTQQRPQQISPRKPHKAYEGIDASVRPAGSLELLSQQEVNELATMRGDGLYSMFRRCALAVLNSGAHIDDARV
ncbi:MAG: DUF4478 domain-containing protein, partial [Gammaproteobacteria bacterium]|nr:DUF4478 domain-containing protein [Gammaproteobacteria bacterium]